MYGDRNRWTEQKAAWGIHVLFVVVFHCSFYSCRNALTAPSWHSVFAIIFFPGAVHHMSTWKCGHVHSPHCAIS